MAKGRSVPFCTKSTFRPRTSVIPFIIEQYLNRPIASSSLKSTRMSISLSSRSSPLENDPNSHALSTGCVARYCCIFGMMSVCVLMFIISSLFVHAAKIRIFRETAKGFTNFFISSAIGCQKQHVFICNMMVLHLSLLYPMPENRVFYQISVGADYIAIFGQTFY